VGVVLGGGERGGGKKKGRDVGEGFAAGRERKRRRLGPAPTHHGAALGADLLLGGRLGGRRRLALGAHDEALAGRGYVLRGGRTGRRECESGVFSSLAFDSSGSMQMGAAARRSRRPRRRIGSESRSRAGGMAPRSRNGARARRRRATKRKTKGVPRRPLLKTHPWRPLGRSAASGAWCDRCVCVCVWSRAGLVMLLFLLDVAERVGWFSPLQRREEESTASQLALSLS
jgi:hypothetical protein